MNTTWEALIKKEMVIKGAKLDSKVAVEKEMAAEEAIWFKDMESSFQIVP